MSSSTPGIYNRAVRISRNLATRPWRLLVLLWLLAACVGTGLLLLPEPARVPLLTASGWEETTGFAPVTGIDKHDLPTQFSRDPAVRFWRSWTPEKGPGEGMLRTAVFTCSAPYLSIPTVGYPGAPGNHLYLEHAGTGQILPLPHGQAHENWQETLLPLDSAWRDQPLRLIAVTNASAYLGFGTPAAAGRITAAKRSLPVVFAVHAFSLGLLWLVAMPVGCLLTRLLPSGLGRPLLIAPVALSASGMAVFYLADAFPKLGPGFGPALACIGAVLGWREMLRFFRHPVRFIVRRPWLQLQIVITACALSLLFAQPTVSPLFQANYRFMPASWSTDNQLPVITAERIVNTNNLRTLRFGQWRVSDRPPSLAGALATPVLLLRATELAGTDSRLASPFAHVAGIAVLSSWTLPLWWLLTRAGWRGRLRRWVVLMLAATPFVFFNTVYTWPKLWSATLVLCGWGLLFFAPAETRRARIGIVAGLAFGGAMLAHGSSVFGLLGVGLLLLPHCLQRRHLAAFATCGVVFALCVASWSWWGKHFAPPGNALAKKALAGTFGFEAENRPLGETIRSAYAAESWTDFARRKSEIPSVWLGTRNPLGDGAGESEPGAKWRRKQFLFLLPCLGPWLLPLLWVALRPKHWAKAGPPCPYAPLSLLKWACAGLVIQALLLWDTHIIHHYAYSTVFVLHFAGIAAAITCGKSWARLLGWFALIWFFTWWIVSPLLDHGTVAPLHTAFALIAPVALLLLSARETEHLFRPATEPSAAHSGQTGETT